MSYSLSEIVAVVAKVLFTLSLYALAPERLTQGVKCLIRTIVGYFPKKLPQWINLRGDSVKVLTIVVTAILVFVLYSTGFDFEKAIPELEGMFPTPVETVMVETGIEENGIEAATDAVKPNVLNDPAYLLTVLVFAGFADMVHKWGKRLK